MLLLRVLPFSILFTALSTPAPSSEVPVHAEVIVYGGTPAGITAAVAAARQGHTVSLVDINNHVGGVVSGGLVSTDIGDRKTVGGLSDEFFKRVEKYYRDKYGPDSKELKASKSGIIFEPHVAEIVFDAMLAESGRIQVWKLHRWQATVMEGLRVKALVAEDTANKTTRTFTGDAFIDASYEGDLMAGAHVPYRVGREGRAEYGEFLAGVGGGPKEQRGMGDHRTQAYNYRVAVTFNTANRVLFPKPQNYDPAPFIETDGKRIKAGRAKDFGDFFTTIEKAGPNQKLDANWGDFVGNSEGYAEGDWTTRERIAARVRDSFQSRLWYVQNDPGLPAEFLENCRKWGLPKDEFTDSGHFPFQLYVREARRMVGKYVLKEQDLTQDRWKPDGIATGSYGVDCHVVQWLYENGRPIKEHTQHVALNNYDIPYTTLVPPDVENLLVPVCCSATHVAYCSLRMEPVYMMLGHAAGDAAHLALAEKIAVQKVSPEKLRELLLKEGSVLDAGYQPQVRISLTPPHPKAGEKVIIKAIPGILKDPLKQIVWDLDGTGKVAAEGERIVHTFTAEKVHTISLLVTDAAGRRRLITSDLPVGSATARDITVDDFDAGRFGRWNGTFPDYLTTTPFRYSDVFHGPGIHCDVIRLGKKAPARMKFQPSLPRAGRYQLCLGFRAAKPNATNVPLTIRHAGGVAKLTVNQRIETTPFNFTPVGEYTFKAGDSTTVEISNSGADGRVCVDGLRFIWLGE